MEPAWKCIVANKAILALLWEMFPDHPNLLPTFYSAHDAEACNAAASWVSKPRFGREGIAVRYSFNSASMEEFESKVYEELDELEDTRHREGYDGQAIKDLRAKGDKDLGHRAPSTNALIQEAPEESPLEQAGRYASSLARSTEKLEQLRSEVPFPPLGGPIFQQYYDTASFNGRTPVVGSWVAHGQPAGICVR